jgi:hypothetical protein
MLLLEYLIHNERFKSYGNSIYIGITKLCCGDCYNLIKQIDSLEVKSVLLEGGRNKAHTRTIEFSSESWSRTIVIVRGSHNSGGINSGNYEGWKKPQFLEELALQEFMGAESSGSHPQDYAQSDSDYEDDGKNSAYPTEHINGSHMGPASIAHNAPTDITQHSNNINTK